MSETRAAVILDLLAEEWMPTKVLHDRVVAGRYLWNKQTTLDVLGALERTHHVEKRRVGRTLQWRLPKA